MKLRDIVIAVLVFSFIGLTLYGIYKVRTEEDTPLIEDTPKVLPSEDEFEENFNFQLPDETDRFELESANDEDASGIVAMGLIDGVFNLTMLADLPQLDTGSYDAYLSDGESEILLGEVELKKGGYILEFNSSEDLLGSKQLVIKKDGEIVARADLN